MRRPARTGWNLIYVSEGADGRLVNVSGELMSPRTTTLTAASVVWNHGTSGSQDSCAPSRNDQFEGERRTRVPALEELLAGGYVVAMSDYQGLGTPGATEYSERSDSRQSRPRRRPRGAELRRRTGGDAGGDVRILTGRADVDLGGASGCVVRARTGGGRRRGNGPRGPSPRLVVLRSWHSGELGLLHLPHVRSCRGSSRGQTARYPDAGRPRDARHPDLGLLRNLRPRRSPERTLRATRSAAARALRGAHFSKPTTGFCPFLRQCRSSFSRETATSMCR